MTTIAVIDDDQTLLDLMADVLAERGWSMLPVRDSTTAVQSLREHRPEVIVLDVRLAGGSGGWDVLEDLEAAPDTRTTPVVVLSADMHLLEEKRAWLHDRRISVLPKPFDLDDLYCCLDRALDEHQAPHQEHSMA